MNQVSSITKEIWNKWKILAEKIGNFQAGLIFSLLYFLIVVPVGIIANFFKDFLKEKPFPRWQKMEDNSSSLKKLKLQ